MDLELIESGDGGELVKKTKDLSVINGFENLAYLAMFGGNVQASTPIVRLENEQAFDWWGNSIFFPNDPVQQFNSQTERVLMQTALNSTGRVAIQSAVNADLLFMAPFSITTVNVSIVDTDKVIIGIRLQQPDNLQSKDFIYLWDATRTELYLRSVTPKGSIPPDVQRFFDESFDKFFE